ncbi:hypothetical protein HK105_201534 [Polyrhizophydium stewartii]|uniref:Uncharacterized protein n=1 Tax=Polyrhizophydium stewartii TaxID=2732419 RepID=A0ABR4NGP0_9FUNG
MSSNSLATKKPTPAPERFDKALMSVLHALLLNPYIAPAFWLFSALGLTVLSPLLLWGACAVGGSMSLLRVLFKGPRTPIRDWSDEIILITGGSHGIGAIAVETFSREKKAKAVVVLDLHPPEGVASNVKFYKCNVANKDEVHDVAARIISEVGHPTALINNAGVVNGKKLVDLNLVEIERTIAVNVLAHFYLIKEFLPGFIRANRGHIVTIASVLATIGSAHVTDYCASKFAVAGLNDSLRQELKGTNVHTSCIYPGLIDSGMFQGVDHKMPWITPPLTPERVAAEIVRTVQLGRSRSVRLPLYTYSGPIMQLLPIEISDFIRKVMGSNDEMGHFKGSLSAAKPVRAVE